MTTTRRRYTDEFKREAVTLVTEQGYAFSDTARRLGVNVSLLRRWRDPFEAEDKGEIPDRDEHAELQRLRAENKRLKMEREILKKAAAFFAKESS